MFYYGSPAEGLAYLESAAADAAWVRAVHAAAVKRRETGDEDEDDGTT